MPAVITRAVQKKTSWEAESNERLCQALAKNSPTKAFHCNLRESELFEKFLKHTAAAQNKSINQKCRAISHESLFNVSEMYQKKFPPRACYMIQENNLFALRSHSLAALFRLLFFYFIKPSYLYPNLASQLCDVCLSVGCDKAKNKIK